MNALLYIICIVIFVLTDTILNKNNQIIVIYKNPIFKLIFLFLIYLYGNNDIVLTSLFAIYYVYLGQKIQEKELKSIL
jgi:hypothetical protein